MARTPLIALVIALSGSLAAPAHATPDCANTGPFTRVCESPGQTAITVTPDTSVTPGFGAGYGWGTPAFGIGGRGLWMGF